MCLCISRVTILPLSNAASRAVMCLCISRVTILPLSLRLINWILYCDSVVFCFLFYFSINVFYIPGSACVQGAPIVSICPFQGNLHVTRSTYSLNLSLGNLHVTRIIILFFVFTLFSCLCDVFCFSCPNIEPQVSYCFVSLSRKDWRYQSGNQKPLIDRQYNGKNTNNDPQNITQKTEQRKPQYSRW